jgi:pimeloyl-ACP methyl ester carboxylesterase
LQLFYKEYGEGKPVVILHGLFGFSDNWKSQAKVLANYFRVIVVDLRNHGRSEWADLHSYEAMANDVIETMDVLNLSQFNVIGHSMGGKVAMHLAQAYPDRLLKTIVVDMGVKSYPMHHQDLIEAIKSVPIETITARSQVNTFLTNKIPEEGVRQFLLKNLYWIERGKLAWRMNIDVLEANMNLILDALPEIEVLSPTLFIKGAESSYILEADYEAIESIFLDSEIHTINEAGHWVHADSFEEFLESVLAFLLR